MHKAIHTCNSHEPKLEPKIAKEYGFSNDNGRPKKNTERTTAVWRNGGCSASYDSFVVGSSAVLRLNFCAKNPPLRQAAKRCASVSSDRNPKQHRLKDEILKINHHNEENRKIFQT